MSIPELLPGLTRAQADTFLALGDPVPLNAGAVLFTMGQPAENMYLVESGCLALTLPMRILGGEEEVLVEEKLPGETLGWSGIIPPHRFTLRATARTDSLLLSFPRKALLNMFNERPEIGIVVTCNVAAVIGRRLQILQAMWLREVQRSVDLRSA